MNLVLVQRCQEPHCGFPCGADTTATPITNHLKIFSWNKSWRAGGGGGGPICGASQSKQAGRDTHGCAAVGEGVHADRAAQLV